MSVRRPEAVTRCSERVVRVPAPNPSPLTLKSTNLD